MFWSAKKGVFTSSKGTSNVQKQDTFHRTWTSTQNEKIKINYWNVWSVTINYKEEKYCPTNDQKNTYLFQTSLVFKYSHSKNNIKMSCNFYITFLRSIAHPVFGTKPWGLGAKNGCHMLQQSQLLMHGQHNPWPNSSL
jgi:hypothetical protein